MERLGSSGLRYLHKELPMASRMLCSGNSKQRAQPSSQTKQKQIFFFFFISPIFLLLIYFVLFLQDQCQDFCQCNCIWSQHPEYLFLEWINLMVVYIKPKLICKTYIHFSHSLSFSLILSISPSLLSVSLFLSLCLSLMALQCLKRMTFC